MGGFVEGFVVRTLGIEGKSLLGSFALRLPRSGHIRHERAVPKCRREAIPLQRISLYSQLCISVGKIVLCGVREKSEFVVIFSYVVCEKNL